MKVKRIFVMVLIMVLSITGMVCAAEESVIREYAFSATDRNYENLTLEDVGKGVLSEIKPQIQIEGKQYKAISIDLKAAAQKKPIKRTRSYTGLTDKKVPETIRLKSGVVLKLADVQWTEHKRQAATGTVTYTGTDRKPEAPDTKDITAVLPDGRSITVSGHLQQIKKSGSSYSKPFTITAKFTGDRDVAYYKLGDTRIPNNPKSPTFDGYEKVLLQHLGLEPGECRLTAGRWTGDYLQENGKTVRYAEFTGLKRSSDWIAYYVENLTDSSEEAVTYDAQATYIQESNDKIDVTATVSYAAEKTGLTLLQKILLVSAAIAIMALLIAKIVMILAKRRKEKEQQV